MIITATIKNTHQANDITVMTNTNQKEISIPGKAEGRGSSVNGGELLFLALATCFCNDVYREAAKKSIEIDSVEVKVLGEFGKEGEPAKNITYEVKIESSSHSQEEIGLFIDEVDKLAEVHNTLRQGVNVSLKLS